MVDRHGGLQPPDRDIPEHEAGGGIGAPLVFGIIGGTLGSIAASIWNLLFNGLGFAAQMGGGAGEEEMAMAGAQLVMGLLFGVCLAPVIIAISLFIS